MYSDKEKEIIIDDICKRISEKGEALRNILSDDDMPSTQTFYKWLEEDDAKSKQYNAIKSSLKGSRANGLNDYRVLNATHLNKKKFPNSSIYVMNIQDSDFYKIGVSQNVSRRHRDIEGASPFCIDIVFCLNVINPYDLENLIHNKYSNKFIKSEWFSLDKKDVINIKNIISKWQEKNIGLRINNDFF